MDVRLVQVDALLLEAILPLIEDYQLFYKMTPHRERNRLFFLQLVQEPKTGTQFAAIEGSDRAVGFATLYFVPSSLSAVRSCILNDLFVVENSRGKGVGRMLIDHCRRFALAAGFSTLEWMTQRQNETAQRLYDGYPVKKSEWFAYELPTQGSP